MLTAHLPSGYCFGKISGIKGWTFAAAVFGAVFPDIDLIFFYFIDDRAVHHHRYWVHIPFFWLVVASISLPFLLRSRFKAAALAFSAAILMHLLLDSISGGILWLAPFDMELHQLVTVSATHSHWILSFIFHWTFTLELLIWSLAFFLFFKSRRAKSKAAPKE